jgi:hypothetical protein
MPIKIVLRQRNSFCQNFKFMNIDDFWPIFQFKSIFLHKGVKI